MKILVPTLAVVLVLAVSGCITKKPRYVSTISSNLHQPPAEKKSSAFKTTNEVKKVYRITNAFTIFLYDPADFALVSSNTLGGPVGGYFDPGIRTLHVPYSYYKRDIRNNPLPDFDTLGHELWHLPELGGIWHTNMIKKR